MNARTAIACLLVVVACAEAESDVGASGSGGTAGEAGASTGGASACVAGKQEACPCPGGVQGIQICNPLGTGYFPCECGSGGTAGSGGGAGGAGGAAGSTGCSAGEKKCGGICLAESPQNGCGAATCTACTAPPNGVAACTQGQCDFTCNAGFQKSGTDCIPLGSGGTSGAGGSSGSGGTSGAGGSSGSGGGSGVCNPLSPQSSAGGYSPCASGETCIPSAGGTTTCVTSGGKGFEQACSAHSECAPGLACAKEFIGGNHCIHYCLNTANCVGTYLCAGSFNPPLYAGSQKLSYCL